MGKGRGVTLKGAAAGAFVRALRGDVAETDEERALRIATFIHMEMKTDRPNVASAIVKLVAKEGLEAAAKACTQ